MATHQHFSRKKQAEQQGWIDPSFPESNLVTNKENRLKDIEAWIQQIWYYRTHLDIFIEEYFSTENHKIKFFPFQKVVIRQMGNCKYIDDVESRGLGKTWKTAWVLVALGVLYPKSEMLVVSKTAKQALLTIRYIRDFAEKNTNVAREIKSSKISKDSGDVIFKNGSRIDAMAMSIDGSNIRGLRKKVIYVDEAGWIATKVVQDVLMPITEKKRDIFWKLQNEGFEDYESKFIQTSSAYLKSCDFFDRFKSNLKKMKIDNQYFVCALPYTIGTRLGILSETFIQNQKEEMPINSFEMEWNARFVGSADGACFPYDLTEPCRTLNKIELVQPKNSSTRYVLSFDIATSESESADNASISLIKIPIRKKGSFRKMLVNIRTFHGFKLENLATELRIFLIRFPNIEKIIIDINGLGEGMLALLNNPFVDDENKEHPPLILDDSEFDIKGLRIIRGVRADNKYNNRMATATRLYLENKTLELPVTSTSIRREYENGSNKITQEHLGVHVEADALQYEMGNIVSRVTHSGNIVYETSGKQMLKDRYTSLGMGLEYIMELEEKEKGKQNNNDSFYMGCATTM